MTLLEVFFSILCTNNYFQVLPGERIIFHSNINLPKWLGGLEDNVSLVETLLVQCCVTNTRADIQPLYLLSQRKHKLGKFSSTPQQSDLSLKEGFKNIFNPFLNRNIFCFIISSSLIQRPRAAQTKEMKQTFLYKTIKLSVGTLVTPKLLV